MYKAGASILVAWTDDTHRPSLEDTGLMQIDLYAGNSTHVSTLARGVLPTVLRQMVSLPSNLPFTIADYTLRFTTTVPPMTVYSADFLISSVSIPTILSDSSGRPALPTVTVTRTTVVAPTLPRIVTHMVTLTQLPVGLSQPALVSPGTGPPGPEITFIEVGTAQDSLTVEAGIQEETEAETTTARVVPIFISRLASTPASSTQSSSSSDLSLTTTSTTSTATSNDSTAVISTSVAKPSSLEASHSSGIRQSSACATLLAMILATICTLV